MTLLLSTWEVGGESIAPVEAIALASRTRMPRLGTASSIRTGAAPEKRELAEKLSMRAELLVVVGNRQQWQLLCVVEGEIPPSFPSERAKLESLRSLIPPALMFSMVVVRARETQLLRSYLGRRMSVRESPLAIVRCRMAQSRLTLKSALLGLTQIWAKGDAPMELLLPSRQKESRSPLGVHRLSMSLSEVPICLRTPSSGGPLGSPGVTLHWKAKDVLARRVETPSRSRKKIMFIVVVMVISMIVKVINSGLICPPGDATRKILRYRSHDHST